MNIESNPPRESVGRFPAAVTISETQTLYWSVRRELWENRSIYIAPLVTAAVLLFGFLHQPDRAAAPPACGAGARPGAAASAHREAVRHRGDDAHPGRGHRGGVLLPRARCTASGATAASCSGSRCRSPIVTTVLSKASIPLVVLPLLTFAIASPRTYHDAAEQCSPGLRTD